jgi:hypothetical protein
MAACTGTLLIANHTPKQRPGGRSPAVELSESMHRGRMTGGQGNRGRIGFKLQHLRNMV